jgi:ferric-dicitrate binding protein FerR (iron transport regulator)
MTDRNHDLEKLDRIVDGIRRADLDDAAVQSASERVWQRITAGQEHQVHGCADYQRLIPDLVAGRLSEARALLVSDHTRECVACRRALLAERSGSSAAVEETPVPARRSLPRWIKLAAAAVLALGLGSAGLVAVGNSLADRRLTATVDSADGSIQRVERTRTEELAKGDTVGSRELLRTSRDSGAQLVLADGSMVEIAPRSELELHGAMSGSTIRLRRGNIIVHAADQGAGHLYVATDDCLVAVRGTVFAVDHGLK